MEFPEVIRALCSRFKDPSGGIMSQKRMHGLRLQWVESYLAVIESGSFTGAAEILGCNQSNVTRHIQELGLWLGYKLILRTVPLKLSDEGKNFHDVAESVVNLLNNSRSEYRLDKVTVPRDMIR